jgi:hypothetical protein
LRKLDTVIRKNEFHRLKMQRDIVVILIAWPAACRIRYSVLGSRGASGKNVRSIVVFLITK